MFWNFLEHLVANRCWMKITKKRNINIDFHCKWIVYNVYTSRGNSCPSGRFLCCLYSSFTWCSAVYIMESRLNTSRSVRNDSLCFISNNDRSVVALKKNKNVQRRKYNVMLNIKNININRSYIFSLNIGICKLLVAYFLCKINMINYTYAY